MRSERQKMRFIALIGPKGPRAGEHGETDQYRGGMNRVTAAFITLGCKVNQYESQALSGLFARAGMETVGLEEAPDVIVLNSCTVTAESDRKDRQSLRRLRREHPHAVLILTGCMPQAFPERAATLTQADIVTGNANNDHLLTLLERHRQTGERVVEIPTHSAGEKISSLAPDGFGERTRAYLKIEDGCNRYCSYCIIPTARGRVRSKPLADIEREAVALAEKGFSEVVLVGINLSAYRTEQGEDLADAVLAAAGPAGLRRVRLGSMEPDQITPDMIDRLAGCDKLCPQFHLSLQSGCDETLQRMNRHYDTAFYRDVCARLRSRFGGEAACSITTDVMVGFPGESEEEFARSAAFVEEMSFAKAHVFAYSRRQGTPAANAPMQVTAAVKQSRSHAMIEAAGRGTARFLAAQIGRIEPVLLETRDAAGMYHGYTPNYTLVSLTASDGLTGKILPVRITGVQGECALGELAHGIDPAETIWR